MGDYRETVTIMDINFINTTKEKLINLHLLPRMLRGDKCFVVTANPEIVMKTRDDSKYKKVVQAANYVIPDGAGILIAGQYMKTPIRERIPGFDLMLDILRLAEKEGLSCYFLGGTQSVNEQVVVEVQKRHPTLKIAGNHHGYFTITDPGIARKMVEAKPDIVFVALGFPTQEKWIARYMDKFSKGLFMGVGGSFDVLAGEVKRAPNGWIKLNLEWLYRLLKQPFRWKRILKVFEFGFRVFLKRY